MKIVPANAALALALGCALLAACDSQPNVLFTSNGADYDVMSLTDAKGDCEGTARVAYLSWWGNETLKGCWVRERGHVIGRFPGVEDRRVPAGEFQRTELAEYRGSALN